MPARTGYSTDMRRQRTPTSISLSHTYRIEIRIQQNKQTCSVPVMQAITVLLYLLGIGREEEVWHVLPNMVFPRRKLVGLPTGNIQLIRMVAFCPAQSVELQHTFHRSPKPKPKACLSTVRWDRHKIAR